VKPGESRLSLSSDTNQEDDVTTKHELKTKLPISQGQHFADPEDGTTISGRLVAHGMKFKKPAKYYGEKMVEDVRGLQLRYWLEPTGILDGRTWMLLCGEGPTLNGGEAVDPVTLRRSSQTTLAHLIKGHGREFIAGKDPLARVENAKKAGAWTFNDGVNAPKPGDVVVMSPDKFGNHALEAVVRSARAVEGGHAVETVEVIGARVAKAMRAYWMNGEAANCVIGWWRPVTIRFERAVIQPDSSRAGGVRV
jgi:Putative peptidoglycan binding domain